MSVGLSPQARFVFRALRDAGYECYLVGGWVRDRLLGRDDVDLDFTTNARPEDLLRVFPGSHYPNRFGTVVVVLDGEQIEITTYRGEGRYSDHRHPDHVAFVDHLVDDLGRRDFTINAMAMDATGTIVDPFGGRADLERRLIRAVGNPAERLAEDPLRMMRAVRLAAQLDLRIDRRTRSAIARDAALLSVISRERIRDELLKILASRQALQGFDLLARLGLLAVVLPELAASAPELRRHARQALRRSRGDALLRLAALLHVLAEGAGFPASALPEGEGQGDGSVEMQASPGASAGTTIHPSLPASLPLRERGDMGAPERSVGAGFEPARPRGPEDQEHVREPLAGVGETPAVPEESTSPLPEGEGQGEGLPERSPIHESLRAALRRELVGLRLSGSEREHVAQLVGALALLPPDLPAAPATARRLLSRLGARLPDALELARAHRLARDPAAANLAQLRALGRFAEQAQRDGAPLTLGDLALSGDDLMVELELAPGPPVGRLLKLLLDHVLDDPALNDRDRLLAIARAAADQDAST